MGIFSPDCSYFDHSCAAATPRRNILPAKPLPARCDAALYTFSNTRGTASSRVGPNSSKSLMIVFMLLDRPSVRVPANATVAMNRAKTWLNGRKSSRRRSGMSIARGMYCNACMHSAAMLRWLISTPFGVPVEPDV